MTNVKLLAYEREFKHVGVCTCGKQWNLPEQKVRKATPADVEEWLTHNGFECVAERMSDYDYDRSRFDK